MTQSQRISTMHFFIEIWKKENKDYYLEKYGELRLEQLSLKELHELYSYANNNGIR